jgi:uncharacterized protein YidB (DUF937 family)
MPSMLALLGLLAVAGYQNRDKIGEALKGLGAPGPDGTRQDGLSGVLGGLGDLFSGKPGAGNVLTGGLGDLMDSFRRSGQADTADSWINTEVPTRGLTPDGVASAIGEDNLTELSRRTGLTRADLLQRLATAIPEGIDKLTPGGNMPASDEDIRDRLTGHA